ncbi:MAG: aromatic-ring-hydroxylating dioxygenase subunit beta, partial [Alphaproteobacteria bacterium]|nr:aromatic-ring-hydroxylating dioxygenase subunit beta [Alphaproteobacteria bacterium]
MMNATQSALEADMALRFEAEALLFREAELLDAWQLDEWRELLTQDASYYVPPNDKPFGDHANTLFIVADDHVRLKERIIRLKDPACHSEFPPSRTRRIISNVRVSSGDAECDYTVRANFTIYRNRRGSDIRIFTGEYINKV